ncbi:hypothetical protein D1831_13245 [Lactiplantibacillus garii]|uniref:Uncharacterized protein n=1 Tax=Lactiplantibacillus garii TaxID=2306423 RepID=A0A3R8J550_9LACO|nr:hypothetical protein [Lactiplantibacillus garii]RRK09344.1 hypothetical protein D1831_13245 [Lactiplantibacillus garii]
MEQLKPIEASLLQAYELNCVVRLTLTSGQRPSGLIAAVNASTLLLNQQAGVVNQIALGDVTAIDFLKEPWWQR